MHFYTKGSIREKTVENGCLGLETHVDVTSDEPPERMRELPDGRTHVLHSPILVGQDGIPYARQLERRRLAVGGAA